MRTCEFVPYFSVTLVCRRDFLKRIIIYFFLYHTSETCTHVRCGHRAVFACDANGVLHPKPRNMLVYKCVVMSFVPHNPRMRFQDASCTLLHLYGFHQFSYCHNAYEIQRAQPVVTPTPIDPSVDPVFVVRPPHIPIRNHLEKWQTQYGRPSEETLSAFEKHPANGEIYNNVSKVSNASATDDQTEGDRWFAGEDDDGEDLITIGLFLKPGDVVELS